MLKNYLDNLQHTINKGDAREESFYKHLEKLLLDFADANKIKNVDITILPKKTDAGNPDFRVWDGKSHITGYIEAKEPSVENLNYIEDTAQLKRYLNTFPNIILTNFYEFRLYRDGELIAKTSIGRSTIARKLQTTPPVENEKEFYGLLNLFFSFSLPKIKNAKTLAVELAKRTRFLRDEVISIELEEEEKAGRKAILGFYEAFKKYLIGTLTKEQFADLYSQTLTYGLFAARTRANSDFNRELAFKFIPNTIGILKDVFRFISLEDPPKSLKIIVDDIAEVLNVTDVKKILHDYFREGKGKDPIIHFYETFLEAYDPSIRERRGVYYTPEPVVGYIVRSIHKILKTHFDLPDGLASPDVTLLDPASGTLTFPAEAIKLAAKEYTDKYGSGGINNLVKKQILPNFYAFELMMAPYAIGHLKMSFLFEELGYRLSDDERFKLYLTNTLETVDLEQINIPGLSSLSEESHLAAEVKKRQPILVIVGNPPYSGHSENNNEWTERLLKEDIDGTQSYYKVDDKPLGEKNPKWLQDDYVKFIRYAQWKIQNAGYGIVSMITNHSYLDNPTFRGMRQSLIKTFNKIYILDLHGNSLKKETTPDGGKDENVFDIRQGVAIALFIKQKDKKGCKVFHLDKYGLRDEKYYWLDEKGFSKKNYNEIKPQTPYYFLVKKATEGIENYLQWKKVNEIFPVNSVGIVTARDEFVIGFNKRELKNRINQFRNLALPNEIITKTFSMRDKNNWNLKEVREEINKLDNVDDYLFEINYRPFDNRIIFYHNSLVERMRYEVMRHMLNEENLGLISIRRSRSSEDWRFAFITNKIIAGATAITALDINYFFPLYLYTEKEQKKKISLTQFVIFEPPAKYKTREPNIDPALFESLTNNFNKSITPEEILYYVYGILYSNTYRDKYGVFLKTDFPRVPFTSNYKLFKQVSDLGKGIADLHLVKSKFLDKPVSKYQGVGQNDKIEKIIYDDKEKRVYINNDKYFDGITKKLWNYQIGGYQVLEKYLKDRKGRTMDDPRYYSKIVTAIAQTIELQKQIDKLFNKIENSVIQ